MDPINTNILYHSDFFGDRYLFQEPQTYRIIWWMFVVIETLLFIRLIMKYSATNLTNTFPYVLDTITQYIVYPFAIAFSGVGGSESHIWITIVASAGYFLTTFALVRFLKAKQYPRSRIERVRALSRKKYSYGPAV